MRLPNGPLSIQKPQLSCAPYPDAPTAIGAIKAARSIPAAFTVLADLLHHQLNPPPTVLTSLIAACSRHRRPDLAVRIWTFGQRLHVKWSWAGYEALCVAFSRAADPSLGRFLWLAVRSGSFPNPSWLARSQIVAGLARAGDLAAALDAHDWCVARAQDDSAVKDHTASTAAANHAAAAGGLSPNVYPVLLKQCAAELDLAAGTRLHAHVAAHHPHWLARPQLASSLLHFYGQLGQSAAVDAVVLPPAALRDRPAWNALVQALGACGRAAEAERAFADMLRAGVAPDAVSFCNLLAALARSASVAGADPRVAAGCADAVHGWFDRMQPEFGVRPSAAHLTTLVAALCGAGRLAEAAAAAESGTANAATFVALLAGCRSQLRSWSSCPSTAAADSAATAGDATNVVAIACRAFDRAMGLLLVGAGQPSSSSNDQHQLLSAAHTLWAGVLASAGDPTAAERVRADLRAAHGVAKLAGVASVRLSTADNAAAAVDFVAGDLRSDRVDDDDDDDNMPPVTAHHHHAERLALAYALKRTPAGGRVAIRSSQRVCANCHAAFARASAATGRELLLRDAAAVHVF
ncbi:hypothetical protein HK405_012692, partial [Cladochytrium tenue]